MEDLVQPKTVPPEVRARRTAVLAGAVGVALCLPLLSVLVRRKPIIPDQDEGYRPVAQVTGHERVTPRIRLEPPVKPRKAHAPTPPSSPDPEPPPNAPAPPETVQTAAPEPPKPPARRKKPRRIVRRTPSPSKPAAKKSVPLVMASQPEPATGLDDVFWLGAKSEPPKTAPPAATPAEPSAGEPAKSRVGGRRAAEPPTIPALEAAAIPEKPCPEKGAWRDEKTRQCFPSRKACETAGGPCVRGQP